MRRVRSILFKQILAIALAVLLCLLAIVAAINARVRRQGGSMITDDWSAEGSFDCILVLGAGLRSDGSPSDMLTDRLRGAIELYDRGVSDVILLSGDRSGEDYDEVGAMRRYCLSMGIPDDALVLDPIGFSTYESVVNTLSLGYERFVIVTQEYHLYRALYVAERLGGDVCGFSADVRSYRGQLFRDAREVVARVKDFLCVSFA